MWMLFLTHLIDLHRALANLARATLESVVQERWVCVILNVRIQVVVQSATIIHFHSSDLDPGPRASSVCFSGNVTWSRSRWRILPWSQPKRLKTCCTHCFHRTWSSCRYRKMLSEFISLHVLRYYPTLNLWTLNLIEWRASKTVLCSKLLPEIICNFDKHKRTCWSLWWI